eukprot:855699-Ditylum_brightwellii.AAC.1
MQDRWTGWRKTHAVKGNLGCEATQAISPHAMCDEPRVQPCWEIKQEKVGKVADKTKSLEEAPSCVLQKKTRRKMAICTAI